MKRVRRVRKVFQSAKSKERWGGITNTNAKSLLNLQTLEFTSEQVAEKQERSNVFIESIRRLRSSLSIQVLEQYDFRKQRYGSNSVVAVMSGLAYQE